MSTDVIGIKSAAGLLFGHDEPSVTEIAEARVILKFHGVKGVDLPPKPGVFGKPAKLYDVEAVRAVAKLRK